MRKQLLAGVAAAAIIATIEGPALAADIARKAPPPPPPPPPPACMWCGFYIGAHVGGAWSKSDSIGIFAEPSISAHQQHSFKPSSAALGFQLGYNWQTGPWVYGLEGDFTALIGHDATADNFKDPGLDQIRESTRVDVARLDWLASVRGRLGYAFDRSLIYGTGGVAFVGGRNDIFTSSSAEVIHSTFTATGWVAGGGWEWKYTPNWSFRVEGLYYGFNHTESGCSRDFSEQLCSDIKLKEAVVVRVGTSYHF